MTFSAPDGWFAGHLGDFIELKRGYDLPGRERRDGHYPIVSSSGPTGTHTEAKVKGPGVVTGRYGTIGEVFFIESDYWPLNTALYVRDFKGNDPMFVSYFLRSIDFQKYVDKAAVPGVNRNHVHMEPVSFPPVQKQRCIAAILGALDDKIELNRKLNRTLEEMAQALFKSWFIDFDGHKDLVDSAIGPVPSGWKVTSVGEHVTLQRGTTYKSALLGRPGPVLLGLGTIQPGGGFRADKLKTYGGDSPQSLLLFPGDVYASLKGATKDGDMVGSVAKVPACVPLGRLTQDTVRLVPKEPTKPIGSFVYRVLRTPQCREYCAGRATGSAQVGLSRNDFLGYPFVVPTDLRLVQTFVDLEQAISRRQECNDEESSTLTTLRDTLLPKLISGELRVPDAEAAISEAL